MATLDSMQLLELRVKKAAFLIETLRKDKNALQAQVEQQEQERNALNSSVESLQQQVADLEQRPAAVIDSAELAALQEQLATLQGEYNNLRNDFDVVKTHNAELEEYVETFTQSEKEVQQSIDLALDTLSSIEGLDDIDIFATDSALELEEAENFTTHDGVMMENIELDDLSDIPAQDTLDTIDELPDLPEL